MMNKKKSIKKNPLNEYQTQQYLVDEIDKKDHEIKLVKIKISRLEKEIKEIEDSKIKLLKELAARIKKYGATD